MMKATLKSLLFLLLSLFQFHGVVSQSCETVFYEGVFYSLDLDRCRCFCVPGDDTSIQFAELFIVTLGGGVNGKCELIDGEDPCTWWTSTQMEVDDVFPLNFTDTNTTDTNTTDTNTTDTNSTETNSTRM